MADYEEQPFADSVTLVKIEPVDSDNEDTVSFCDSEVIILPLFV
jgi:hypothetical protein